MRLTCPNIRERNAVLPDGLLVPFDASGVSDDVPEASGLLALDVPGISVYAEPPAPLAPLEPGPDALPPGPDASAPDPDANDAPEAASAPAVSTRRGRR